MASGSRSISKGSEEAFLYECDPCKYQKITSEAKAYCTVCTEYLCQRCEQAHKGSRATRDHKILTGKDIHSVSMTTKPNLPVMYCEVHKAMVLNSFCKSHDDVICDTCKITDHRKCVITDVSNQTKQVNVIKTLDETVKSLTDTKNQYEKLKDSRKADKGKVKFQLSKCLDDMRKMRKEINETFDKLERKFERRIAERQEHMKKEIDGHITKSEDALIQISDKIRSLDVCRKTNDADVMFVGMKKANKLKSKYDQTISTMQQANYSFEIRFRPIDVIKDAMQKLESIGTLECEGHRPLNSQKAASLLDMAVVDKHEINVGTSVVLDCALMKSGHLALACGDTLLLLDESFNVLSKLYILTAIRIAAINKDEVVVSQGENKQILRVRLFPQMVVMSIIKMDIGCWGMDVFNEEIYVACHDGKGHGEVQVLSIDGVVKRKVELMKCMYIRTNIVKVSPNGSKIFVNDVGTHKVMCLSQQGHMIYSYTYEDLKTACGLYVDEEDTLLVCGYNSHNIHMVDRDGRKVKVWLTQKDGVVYPACVSYRARDGVLVVGMLNRNKPLIVFTTKMS